MYSHPQGGRFVPNVTTIPGQTYVYHPPAGAHTGVQNSQITPSAVLNQTGVSFSHPQTTNAILASSTGYHGTPPPTAASQLQPQYITQVDAIHPIQTPSISIKIEKPVEDSSTGAFHRAQNNSIVQKGFNQAQPHHVLTTSQQHPTIVVQEAPHPVRPNQEHDAVLARQEATKMILQQQQAQHQHVISLPDVHLSSQIQKDEQVHGEIERREKEIQRQKVIEDHQKQKNSNRIFSKSTKNLTDAIKSNTSQTSNKNTTSSSKTNSTLSLSTLPSEHGFRKITATTESSNPPKPKSPIPPIDAKLYKCIVCGYLAESAALLGRHAFEIHEKRSKKWRIGQKFPVRHECEECDYETPDIHRLHRHMQRVHDTDQVFHFQCKACDFVATSADLLGRHALEVHESGSVFRCSVCDFTSNRKSDRDKHFTGAHQLDYDTHLTTNGGTSLSRQVYICLVPTCKEQIRGDKLQEHYKKLVQFDLLEEDDDTVDKKISALSRREAHHTQYFLDENLDAHSIPGYKRHRKLPQAGSSSDADSSFDLKERRKQRKRRGNIQARKKRSRNSWEDTDSEDEEKELKMELKELGVPPDVIDESEIDNSSNHEKELNNKNQRDEQKMPIINDVIAKTIEKVLEKNFSENSNDNCDVFPKKCSLCSEILSDKLLMIEHIRNMHMLKTRKITEKPKPKFEIIRQKTSKCLDIVREEIPKCN